MRSRPGRFPSQGTQLIRPNFPLFVAEMLREQEGGREAGRFGGGMAGDLCGGMSIWVAFSDTCGEGLSSPAKEAIEENQQDAGADGDVESVALKGKSDDAEDDAEDRRGDEEEESELDDAGGVQVSGGVEQY